LRRKKRPLIGTKNLFDSYNKKVAISDRALIGSRAFYNERIGKSECNHGFCTWHSCVWFHRNEIRAFFASQTI
jgi:hypothetical protein